VEIEPSSVLKRLPSLPAAVAAAALAACSSPSGAPAEVDGNRANPSASGPEATERPCALEPERPSPSTVLEVIERVNELPQPVTLACFLDSLARPLELNATESLISAQPAMGRRSPRLFIFVDPLIMSISFDGTGSRLLELGEVRPGGTRALKAEIEFPVIGELPRAEPFERILFLDDLTTCGGCHDGEQPAPDVTFTKAFESQALKPVPNERVSLESLLQEREACDPGREPARCALLEAVFGPEAVVDREFPASMATFY
jgi:hypothetical protein